MKETQMKDVKQELEDAVILERAHAVVEDCSLQYALSVTRAGDFWIALQSGGEGSCRLLGRDLHRAIEYFDRIVAGRTTPCALGDVVADLLWSETLR
jgi:hypothetical protein